MADLYRTNGSSPPRRCGTTNGLQCWRASLQARRRVDHWCDDAPKHLGGCICAGCGTIIALRPMWRARWLEEHATRPRSDAELDAATRVAGNAEIRGYLKSFAFRFVVLAAGGGGLTRLGIDGRLVAVMVAVVLAGLWWLTGDEA